MTNLPQGMVPLETRSLNTQVFKKVNKIIKKTESSALDRTASENLKLALNLYGDTHKE